MKPRSIVALIVAAVFVLGGVIVCSVSSSRAKAAGIMLFPEADDNGNLVYKMDLGTAVKVTVNTADADITIVGGASESYIEVVNFNANYYKLSRSSESVVFAQVDDFLSMFKFWENGFSFKGMRYLLRFGDDIKNDKQVIVHLSDSDNIRHIDASTDTGNIVLKDCLFAADYILKSTNGNISAADISNSTSLSVSGSTFDLSIDNLTTQKLSLTSDVQVTASLNNVTASEAIAKISGGAFDLSAHDIGNLSITSESAEVKITDYNCDMADINTTSGDVSTFFKSVDSLAVSVITAKGKISENGVYVEKFSLNKENAAMRVNINTVDGDVVITYPEDSTTLTEKTDDKTEA